MACWIAWWPEYCKALVFVIASYAIAPTMLRHNWWVVFLKGLSHTSATCLFNKVLVWTIRIVPELLEIMRERGVYNRDTLLNIADKMVLFNTLIGCARRKDVFKTAFEINQYTLIDLAADRQKYVCQGQSLNLFLVPMIQNHIFLRCISMLWKILTFCRYTMYVLKAGVSASTGNVWLVTHNINSPSGLFVG